MNRKDYDKAAEIVRQDADENGDIFSKLMQESFVQFFQKDNPRFDANRFRQACKGK